MSAQDDLSALAAKVQELTDLLVAALDREAGLSDALDEARRTRFQADNILLVPEDRALRAEIRVRELEERIINLEAALRDMKGRRQ